MKDKEKQYISMKEMLTKRSFEPITNCNCRKDKEIHIYYINKIKDLDYKIFEYEDDDYPNWRAVKICERNIEKWLDKAGITDKELRREIREVCIWSRDLCATLLESKGWKVLYGKENYYER